MQHLIKYHHRRASEYCSGQSYQLPLSLGEILPARFDGSGEAPGLGRRDAVQDGGAVGRGVLGEGVEVAVDGAGKKVGVLGKEGLLLVWVCFSWCMVGRDGGTRGEGNGGGKKGEGEGRRGRGDQTYDTVAEGLGVDG